MNGKFITPANKYTEMQQRVYNHWADVDGDASGWCAGEHEEFPVAILRAHNTHKDYEEYLWKDIPDLISKDVLDFGCGPGRNLLHYHNKVKSIDGVDLAERNLRTAALWLSEHGIDISTKKFYKNNGVNLDIIPSESYDVIMSTICLQHISVYDIRYSLLSDMFRVLRPGGYLTVQFLLNSEKPGTVKYYDNFYDSADTNGGNDCVVEDPQYAVDDLKKIGFTNIHYYIRPSAELLGGKISNVTDRDWLYINGQKP